MAKKSDELIGLFNTAHIHYVCVRSPIDFLKRTKGLLAGYPKQTWAFRGLSASEQMQTSLERAARLNGVRGSGVSKSELQMIRCFARDFPREASDSAPEKGETIDTLALMQHYGAPTRLLDFTYSPLVAALFALDRAGKQQTCAILAIETQWLQDEARRMLGASEVLVNAFDRIGQRFDSEAFRDVFFRKDRVRFVCAVNANRRNRRLRAQKGVFLIPGDVEYSFVDNLCEMNGYEKNVTAYILPWTSTRRREWMKALTQSGMSNYSLFPDLEGYGRSLWRDMMYYAQRNDPFDASDLAYF